MEWSVFCFSLKFLSAWSGMFTIFEFILLRIKCTVQLISFCQCYRIFSFIYLFLNFFFFISLEILMEFHIFVVKGDEMSLQRALYMIHRRSHNYVVFLFYASWCPFSITFRPIFSVLSSLFPSIPHFAIEESAIKPRWEHP